MILKNKKKYIIELDDELFELAGKAKAKAKILKPLDNFQEISGECCLITDFQGAISKIMLVEAQHRYVEIIVARKLQEAGEFDEPVIIITHWKQKAGKNSSEIFFTAIPTRIYLQYQEDIKVREDNLILFPLYGVLWDFLKRLRPKKPAAVLFLHGRFADLIIGTKNKIHYVNRLVAFDKSDQQIESLWERIRSDIESLEKDKRISIEHLYYLDWFDKDTLPEWPADSTIELIACDKEQITLKDTVYQSSFLKSLKKISVTQSINSILDKIYFFSRKIAPYGNIMFLLLSLILIGGYWVHQKKSNLIEQQISKITQHIEKISVNPVDTMPLIIINDTLSFVKAMASYKKTSSFNQVLNDISAVLNPELEVEDIKLEYTAGELRVELSGNSSTSFDKAYQGFQTIIKGLESNNYKIEQKRFDTKIRSSRFFIKLKKIIS